jgi:hypothetical protein
MTTVEMNRFTLAVGELMRRVPAMFMEIDTLTAITAVSYLQLALRHPGAQGPASERVRLLIGHIIDTVHRQSPTVADLLRSGNNPMLDVEV